MMLCAPVISIFVRKWNIHYFSLLAMVNLLRSNTNQELIEKRFCNQNSHYKNTDVAACPCHTNYCVKVKYSLHFFINYVQPVKQQHESRAVKSTSVIKVATVKIWTQMVPRTPVISIIIWSEVFITLICQLCLTRYTAENQLLCNQSSLYEKNGRFPLSKENHHMLPPNQHFCCQQRWMEHKGRHW